MTLETILFIVFASICAVSAVLMITRPNPVLSALFLVLNFASLAGLYLLLNAQFIAVAQVIVYAGAIMVFFLFVIMLLNPEKKKIFLNKKLSLEFLLL
ncbi:MAG: NADH-quinone oxidoreductase subunit J [Ignavibacteriaceae bacterium]|nr:NADH-quinone oxidoreductase subunit J [Ignavibacteriaceae bacterium]